MYRSFRIRYKHMTTDKKKSTETLTKATLAEHIHDKHGYKHHLSKATSMRFVEALFNKIEKTLSKGEELKITSFGSFIIREKNPRIGRNPKTGIEAKISKRKVVTFRSSQALRNQLNLKK